MQYMRCTGKRAWLPTTGTLGIARVSKTKDIDLARNENEAIVVDVTLADGSLVLQRPGQRRPHGARNGPERAEKTEQQQVRECPTYDCAVHVHAADTV